MKILEIQKDILFGYRIVSQSGDDLVTLAGGELVDPTIDKETSYKGNGLYLGATKKFTLDYYTGLSDLSDVMLTYSFDTDDVLSGDPTAQDGEITVSKATLKRVTPISGDA